MHCHMQTHRAGSFHHEPTLISDEVRHYFVRIKQQFVVLRLLC